MKQKEVLLENQRKRRKIDEKKRQLTKICRSNHFSKDETGKGK